MTFQIPCSSLRNALFAIACLFTALFGFAANASAENGDFELGLSAGYNYAMALNPVDASAMPEAVVDGHGFTVTISPGARLNDYIGIYVDFGLNLSYIDKNKTFNETVFHKGDFMYSYNVMLALRFYQKLYDGEFFEGIAIGYDYASDNFDGEAPGSGFAMKVSFGYIQHINRHFGLGVACNVISNHKFERDYFNFSVDAQIVTTYRF